MHAHMPIDHTTRSHSQAAKKTDVRVACVALRDDAFVASTSHAWGKMRRRSSSQTAGAGAPKVPEAPELLPDAPITNEVIWLSLAVQRSQASVHPEVKVIAGDQHCLTLASNVGAC